MTPIESGSTLDQRIRTGIFLLMCLAMGGWFAYDGLVGYARKNLEWAAQKLPQRPPDLRASPRVTRKNLEQVLPGHTPEQVRQRLGEPALELPRTLVFVGREATVTVGLDDAGRVTTVRLLDTSGSSTTPGPGDADETTMNILVTRARAELVREGMTEIAVRQLLGEPASARPHTLWYIGPAAYGEFHIVDGRVAADPRPDVQENEHRSEWQILLQKLIAAAVGLVALYGAWRFWAALRARIRVDDTGLTFNGRHVPWESMLRLQTDRYVDKAWVDLEYRDGDRVRSLRLDALFIQRFNEIADEICRRKGFVMPARRGE